MTQYLLDTNIVLRLSNPADRQHRLVVQAVATLLARADECYLTAQILIEFWVVATRPIDVNGLGWSIEQARHVIDRLRDRFPVAEETQQSFPIWLNIVTENKIRGKRTHDARLIAVMLASNIDCILTLNPNDFLGISGITVVHPQEITRL
ncbi:PIN domain-containing protein [Lusitaniella coriacea LEGE 07157]|uniref:PIN domain-containing protein n=1 Tax=Lusitaniella coriacea LEGE 07157 TaxID=945747 RepID=A0A8J7ASB2_9CYAN|nr:PIN domain-containing protein [Lusitaniella coriacea]MBE9115421.1 PIN domain-containing protein [Lusitaniella coriacea LEGE 07157]